MRKKGSWLEKNPALFARVVEIIFGVVWGIDGAFKFIPGVVQAFPQLLQTAAAGQPAWLAWWFSFWSTAAAGNAALFVYSIGLLELALSFSLIFGFARRIGYSGGFVLSLLIWSVPEGFGGPYGPGATDIGTGIIYALAFLMLIALNVAYGSHKMSADNLLSRKFRRWRKIAAF